MAVDWQLTQGLAIREAGSGGTAEAAEAADLGPQCRSSGLAQQRIVWVCMRWRTGECLGKRAREGVESSRYLGREALGTVGELKSAAAMSLGQDMPASRLARPLGWGYHRPLHGQ